MNKHFYLYTSLPLDGITIPKHIKIINGTILCIRKDSDLKKLNSVSGIKKFNVAILGKNPVSSEAIKMYIATRLKFPKAQLLFQPSLRMTEEVWHQIIKIGYNGIVWNGTYKTLISLLISFPTVSNSSLEGQGHIKSLRHQIDVIDEKLLNDLSKRSELVRKLGTIKNEMGISIVQPERWSELVQGMIHLSAKKKLSESFIYAFMELIHLEAIKQQLDQK